MDPDVALREIRSMVAAALDDGARIDIDELAILVESLDNWISRGGFLPKSWRQPVDNPRADSLLSSPQAAPVALVLAGGVAVLAAALTGRGDGQAPR